MIGELMTKRTAKNSGEQGVALIIALFALLLLSAIGLGLMYSSTTETSVNANFRDKQIATYAALSGALEARDRLQPANGDIAAPAGLPSTSAANVIYIINPAAGEDPSEIEPWDSSNKYADTELCVENIPGFCSGGTLPSGSWFTTKDNSSSDTFGNGYTSFYQSTPLQFKWARITLKANNMTPVAANGSFSAGNQVCWDGKNQVVIAPGASSTCLPTGAVTSVTLISAGTGYNSTPHVTIGAPPSGGTQATAIANMSSTTGDQVVSGAITKPGSGYSSAPTVTLVGNGIGATAQAVISPLGAPVASVTGLSSASASTACYAVAPGVSFSGGGDTLAASATSTLGSNTCIYAASASKQGNCSYVNQSVPIGISGGGSGFAGTLNFDANGKISSVTITSPGTGFTSTSGLTITGTNCNRNPKLNFTLGAHAASVSVTNGGAGYKSVPTVVISAPPSGNAGTVQTATAVLGSQPANAGQVTGLNITSSGSGYTSAPTVVFGTDGGGTGAAGTTSLGNNNNLISSISITNAGSGYTSAPTVSFSGGGGSGATAKATISSGTYYGQVFLITSFAQTPSGSTAMKQMEVASAVRSFSVTGALTLDGPSPSFSPPSSQNFYIDGHDANSCGETPATTKPAIGVYDNPNSPTSPSAQSSVISSIESNGKPDNYTGSNSAPNVENVYGALGDSMTTVTGMEDLANAIAGMSDANTYNSGSNNINLGTSSVPAINVVNGDLTLSGNSSGYGILLVRGNLTMSGNFSWHGPIFVIGTGQFSAANGGGNGQIVGTLFVAQTRDPSHPYPSTLLTSLGEPSINFNGGGGNYIQYDHCWADDFYAKIPFVPPPGTSPLKILSTRTVTF